MMNPAFPVLIVLTDADNGQPVDVLASAIGTIRVLAGNRTEITMTWGQTIEVRESRHKVNDLRVRYAGLLPPMDPLESRTTR